MAEETQTSGLQMQTLPQDRGAAPLPPKEVAEGIAPSYWQKFMVESQLKLMNSFIGVYGAEGVGVRYLQEMGEEAIAKKEGRKKLTAEEANKLYPEMEEKFTTDVDEGVAKLRWDNQKRIHELRKWAARGPDTGFGFELVTSVPTMFDPANLAIGLATGGSSLFAQTALNIAGNLAMDIPTTALLRREQQSVDYVDTAIGSVVGGVAGTAFSRALGLALRGGAKLAGKMDADTKLKAAAKAFAQHETDQKIDTSSAAAHVTAKVSGEVKTGVNPYEFKDISHPSEVTLYGAVDPKTNERVNFGDRVGEGAYLIDDFHVANNTGDPVKFELPPDSKFIDLEKPLPTPLVNQALAEIKKAGLEGMIGRQDLAEMPGKQVLAILDDLDQAPEAPKASEVFRARAIGEGFDGYREVITQGDKQKNAILLFDDQKFQPVEQMRQNPETVPDAPREEVSGKEPPLESRRDYDPEVEQKAKELLQSTPKEIDVLVKDLDKQAELVLRSGEESPALKEELDKIDSEFKELLEDHQIVTAFADCVSKGII